LADAGGDSRRVGRFRRERVRVQNAMCKRFNYGVFESIVESRNRREVTRDPDSIGGLSRMRPARSG